MEYSNYRLSLDVQAAGSGVVLSAKRGDTGRRLFVTLTDGGRPYTVGSDCYAVLTALKPDGHLVFNECTLEGNVICYTLREQLLAALGPARCELRLYGADAMLLTSASFEILVENTVYNEGDMIESSDDLSALSSIIGQAQQLQLQLLELKTQLETLKKELEGSAGGIGGTTFYPAVDTDGNLSWTNDGGLENPEPVNIKGDRGEAGTDGPTVQEVLDALPRVSAIDFAGFEGGSFTETVDGEVICHSVSFDDEGRPVGIDGVAITWGDA